MTNFEVAPVYVLRRYAWGVLKTNDPGTWDESKYGGLVPIVPLNEEPELAEYDGPRIVYDYTHNETGTTYFRGRGTMTFAIRDHNFRRMTKTLNMLQAAFERHDESARDVNDFTEWLAQRDVNGNATGVDFDVSFGFIRVGFVESGTPEEEEGGMMVAIISITYDYYLTHNVDTAPRV